MGDFIVVEGKPDENISDLRKLRLWPSTAG